MNDYEKNTSGETPFVGDAPADGRWSTPPELSAFAGQPPVTPPPSTYAPPPVYDPNTTPRKHITVEETPVYSTGVVQAPKNRAGWFIALSVSGVVLMAGVLALLGLIPGLPNYRFAEAGNNAQSANAPGFEANNSPQLAAETVPDATGSGKVEMELESIPGTATKNGALSLQEIYEKTIPSVTSIICDRGSGTGVVLTKDGYILTNYHVIEGARRVEVLLSDGRQLPATVIGRDQISDLAVLHISANDLTPASFGNSDQVRVGDTVVAIGDPLGVELRGTMTDGIISAINRDVVTDQGRTMTVIQTNAALNPGNSGGPLINIYGQVIGINTMKIGDNMAAAGVEGLGFAIPSTTVKDIVDQLMTIGHVTGRPYLGIDTEEYGVVMNYLLPPGLYISHVADGTDAAAKGITAGEVLLEFNGVPVTTNYELQAALEKCSPGQRVVLVLYRQGYRVSIEIELGEAQ